MCKALVKRLWHSSPFWLQAAFLRALCLACIGQRKPVPAGMDSPDVPLYVLGPFQAGGGLARSAQLYAEQAVRDGRQCYRVDTSRATIQSFSRKNNTPDLYSISAIRGKTGPGVIVIHANPPQFIWLLCLLGRAFLRGKTIVGYWAWELEDIPRIWLSALAYADQIEVPSIFTQKAIARHTGKPVTVKPHQLPVPARVKTDWMRGNRLNCLFIWDMGSRSIRKNPEAVIRAFVKAFGPNEARLTLKPARCMEWREDYGKLTRLIAPYPHISIDTEWLSDEELEELYLSHDVFISLHHSEGYGLSIREAMLRGLHIVATGWSGNMDYMQGYKVHPVPYTLVPVPEEYAKYARVDGARWAEADINATSQILKEIARLAA